MTPFDADLAATHRRELHHDAQAASRARRIRTARRWNRKASAARRRAADADSRLF